MRPWQKIFILNASTLPYLVFFLNFRFLSLVVSELLGGPKVTLGDLSPPESFLVEKFLDPKRVLYSI